MADKDEPVYLIDDVSEPPVLKIQGRASYLNCGPLADFFSKLLKKDMRELCIDFSDCQGMDSTFLGILAGAALEYRRQRPPCKIKLFNLNKRNLQLVKNLGLHCILELCKSNSETINSQVNYRSNQESVAKREQICSAHENLVEVDPDNMKQFKDVLRFLGNS